MKEKFESGDLQEEYGFLDLRFLPNEWHIAVAGSSKTIPLTRMQREFLLVLVKKANELVSYDDLRQEIWAHETEVDQRFIHTMHAAKSKLVRLFTDNKIDATFLESVDGKGYKLNAVVTHKQAHRSVNDFQTLPFLDPKPLLNFTDNQFTNTKSPIDFTVQNESKIKIWQLVFVCVFTAIISIVFWQHYVIETEYKDTTSINSLAEGKIGFRQTDEKIEVSDPLLEKAEYITDPRPKKEFYLHLKGKNINPERVRLKVTGPGCGGDDPCTVPNGALRLYGRITETSIEKAPLTLGHGEYNLWLENDAGFVSNKLTIAVQGEVKENLIKQ